MTALSLRVTQYLSEMGWSGLGYAATILYYLGPLYTGRFKLIETRGAPLYYDLRRIYESKYFAYKDAISLGTYTVRGTTNFRYLLYNWKKK